MKAYIPVMAYTHDSTKEELVAELDRLTLDLARSKRAGLVAQRKLDALAPALEAMRDEMLSSIGDYSFYDSAYFDRAALLFGEDAAKELADTLLSELGEYTPNSPLWDSVSQGAYEFSLYEGGSDNV